MLKATLADLKEIAKADTLIYKCEGPVVLLSALYVCYFFLLFLVNYGQVALFNRAIE